MPVYGPKFTETDFKSGKNILASEHLQFIEAGATLDAEKFDKGTVEVGKQVAQNKDTGKFEPVDGMTGEELDNYKNFGIMNVDFKNDGDMDGIVGEIIVRGSVYEEKLPEDVEDDFKDKVPMIRFVKQTDFGGDDE